MFCSLAILAILAGMLGCDADSPARFTTNQRVTTLELQPAAVPAGQLIMDCDSCDVFSVTLDQLPTLQDASGARRPFVYEAWLSFEEPDSGLIYVSVGRFRSQQSSGEALFPRGSTSFTYDRLDGSFEVTAGGAATSSGAPLPVPYGPEVNFFIAIEPDPDESLAVPTPIRLLVLPTGMPDRASTLALIVPVDIGQASAGTFDRLESELIINTVTGEYSISFHTMSFFDRSEPGLASDPGLIYQAWFVDDDLSPPRVFNIGRFNANLAGDAEINAQLNPGDSDGDLYPEPLDFERIFLSVEPDGIVGSVLIGSGLDTATRTSPEEPDVIDHIFPFLVYTATIPDVR